MHDPVTPSPTKEVGAGPPELPGAGPGQEKPNPPILDQQVHFVQELRALLDFVDAYDAVRQSTRQDLLADESRVRSEPEKQPTIQQVVDQLGLGLHLFLQIG